MKDLRLQLIITLVLVCLLGIAVIFLIAKQENEIIIEPTYSIYEYDYGTTVVYRYKEYHVIYEYSYAGVHIIRVKIDGIVTPLEFPDQNTAKEFANSYLSDIRRDEQI